LNLEEKVEHIIEPSLTHEGYGIVRLHITGNQRKVVQIMIERLDAQEVTLDDCVKVSRYSSTLLDVEDPFPFAYTLEVSSPGMDRPLVKPKDFIRFSGHDIKINLTEAVHSRKRFIAHLNHADNKVINVSVVSDAKESAVDDEGNAVFEDKAPSKKKSDGNKGDVMLTFDIPYDLIKNAKLHIDFDNYLVKKGQTSGKSKD
jgi:ribosome maturation factor RimP